MGLQVPDDLKQVARPRISLWAEGPHETLGRHVSGFCQLSEADSGIDGVAQDRPARLHVTRKQRADAFLEHRLPRIGVSPGTVHRCCSESSCKRHGITSAASPSLIACKAKAYQIGQATQAMDSERGNP